MSAILEKTYSVWQKEKEGKKPENHADDWAQSANKRFL